MQKKSVNQPKKLKNAYCKKKVPDIDFLCDEWGHIELKSWLDRPSRIFFLYGGPLRPVVNRRNPWLLNFPQTFQFFKRTPQCGALCCVRDDTERNPDICRHHRQSEAGASRGGWGGERMGRRRELGGCQCCEGRRERGDEREWIGMVGGERSVSKEQQKVQF